MTEPSSAQRIALEKFRVPPVGRAIVPAQLSKRDGIWHQEAAVGTAPLSLRLAALSSVLGGCEVDQADGAWTITNAGRAALELE
jgi:hypothetical protein